MPDEDNKEAKEFAGSKETDSKGSPNGDAKQSASTESGSTPGETKSEQVDLAQIHDMLKEKDTELNELRSQIADLKKVNTELILKVNSGSSKVNEDPFKVLYDEVVDRK